MNGLPEGFVPDEPEQQPKGQTLPAGFVADDPETAQALDPDAGKNGLRHGAGQTFVRSAMNTALLNHYDEITGWIGAALEGHPFDGEAYRRNRDLYRGEMKAGNEAHPVAHWAGVGAGAVASTLIPGLNVAKGASLGRAVGQGAAMGAAAGLGDSEADLTKGEFGKAALDTALGAGIGAGAGAIGHKLATWMQGAPARAADAEVAGLKQGVQYSTKLKTFGKATPEAPQGQFADSIKKIFKTEPAIAKAAIKEPARALGMVDQKVGGLVDTLDHIYTKAQSGGPASTEAAVDALTKVEEKFRGTVATEGLADTVASVAKRMAEKYPEGIPVEALRTEYRAWQDIANKAMKVFSAKSPKEEISEEMANALREVLQSHVAKVAEANPALGISRKALEATNKEVSTWIRVQGALTEKVTRASIGAPPMGDLIMAAVKHPLRSAARAIIPSMERVADPRMAALIRASEAGDGRAAALLRAMYGAPSRAGGQEATSMATGVRAQLAAEGEDQDQPTMAAQ